jgi:hypothetical protein
MKRTVMAAATLCCSAICLGATSKARATPASQDFECVARVLHSEELPYAPIGYWLAKVTLEVTPSKGPPFIKTLYDNVPWQRSSRRRGETFKLRCDPADGRLY